MRSLSAITAKPPRRKRENIARSLFSLQINPLAGQANAKNRGEIRYNGTLRASAAIGQTRHRNPAKVFRRKFRTQPPQGACGS
jgi:hypothetical protein